MNLQTTPRKKLRTKYGQLTVVSENTVDGRRTAIVNCSCGTQKRVMVDALTSGRTKSCGALACKYRKRKVRAVKSFTPRGSRTVPPKLVRKLWGRVHHATSPITIQQAADDAGIESVQTLYSVFRAVRKAGGIDKYMESVQ